MMDARKACAELCEVSELALYLASRGRKAGLHQVPLFSLSLIENRSSSASAVREQALQSWGKQSEEEIGPTQTTNSH